MNHHCCGTFFQFKEVWYYRCFYDGQVCVSLPPDTGCTDRCPLCERLTRGEVVPPKDGKEIICIKLPGVIQPVELPYRATLS